MRSNVLFLCTGNSARSQMAEAFLRKYAGDRFDVYSAGTEPKPVNPHTVRVMAEVGIDVSQQKSKGIQEFLRKIFPRWVIVLCKDAETRCPTVWPAPINRLVWPFDDPSACKGSEEMKLDAFRKVRDQIEARIRAWVSSLPAQ